MAPFPSQRYFSINPLNAPVCSSCMVLMEKKKFYVPIKAGLLQTNWVCSYIYKKIKKITEGGFGGLSVFCNSDKCAHM